MSFQYHFFLTFVNSILGIFGKYMATPDKYNIKNTIS